jgi:ribose 5-phosphate isomerase B
LNIAIAADHGGFVMKASLIPWLEGQGHTVLDLGANVFNIDDDYPDFAHSLSESIILGKAERGILLCGSGVGASIAANKIHAIRAAVCHDTYSAHQGVEHDQMNILCLGARVIGIELAKDLLLAFLGAQFIPEEKYQRRVDKVKAIEESVLKKHSGVDR